MNIPKKLNGSFKNSSIEFQFDIVHSLNTHKDIVLAQLKLELFYLILSLMRKSACTPEDSCIGAPEDSSAGAPEESRSGAPGESNIGRPKGSRSGTSEDSSDGAPEDSSTGSIDDSSADAPEDSCAEAPEDFSVGAPDGSLVRVSACTPACSLNSASGVALSHAQMFSSVSVSGSPAGNK